MRCVQSGTGARAVRKRKTAAWSDDGSAADSSGEGAADTGSGDEGDRSQRRAPPSGASAAAGTACQHHTGPVLQLWDTVNSRGNHQLPNVP